MHAKKENKNTISLRQLFLTFMSAKEDTPPATRRVQIYSGKVYRIP